MLNFELGESTEGHQQQDNQAQSCHPEGNLLVNGREI